MRRKTIMLLLWLLTFALVKRMPGQGREGLSLNGVDLSVSSVTKLTTPSGSHIYQIEVNYKSSDQFVVNGLPQVAGQGTLVFLSREPLLALADPAAQSIRQTVPLHQIDVPAGSTTLEVPELSDFPAPQLYPFASNDQSGNEQKTVAVMRHYFPQGVLPLTYTRPFRLVSYCHVLEDVQPPYRGKVAVIVEFPVDSIQKSNGGYRLSWVAYESRLASSSWPKATTRKIVDAATNFVNRLTVELSR
jgi:hypothetical protein